MNTYSPMNWLSIIFPCQISKEKKRKKSQSCLRRRKENISCCFQRFRDRNHMVWSKHRAAGRHLWQDLHVSSASQTCLWGAGRTLLERRSPLQDNVALRLWVAFIQQGTGTFLLIWDFTAQKSGMTLLQVTWINSFNKVKWLWIMLHFLQKYFFLTTDFLFSDFYFP